MKASARRPPETSRLTLQRNSAPDPAAQRIDGRLNRSTRTRAAIIDALIHLVGEGNLVPTSEEVAAQAKVGLRTVFRHFEDMETLYGEVNQAIQASVMGSFSLDPLDDDLEIRLRALLKRRGALFARLQPFVASTIARKWRSPFLERSHRLFTELQWTYLLDSLPEVAGLSKPLQTAVDQITSFDSWNRMRHTQGLSQKMIENAQTEGVLTLLKALA